jgi:hypothetical protein
MTFLLMDASGPDQSSPIGQSVGELLDWLWDHRIPYAGTPVEPSLRKAKP